MRMLKMMILPLIICSVITGKKQNLTITILSYPLHLTNIPPPPPFKPQKRRREKNPTKQVPKIKYH